VEGRGRLPIWPTGHDMGNTFLPFGPQAKKTVEKGKNNRPPHHITHCIVGVWGIDWSTGHLKCLKTTNKEYQNESMEKDQILPPLYSLTKRPYRQHVL